MYRILVCDDEADIVSALKIYLEAEGYEVVTASNGLEAIELAKQTEVQLILLDIMMPELDGISAMVHLREECNAPVILLTAKAEDADKILGLDMGADDYITKPFSPAVLLARVRSQLRRYTSLGGVQKETGRLIIGGVVLDDQAKTVEVDGIPAMLTPIEFNLLKYLMTNAGKVFSTTQIYEAVWNDPAYGADGTVAVHIRHIREKIEADPAEPRYIKVVWGQGYKFENIKNRGTEV